MKKTVEENLEDLEEENLSYSLGSEDRSHGVQIGHGELNALGLELLIDLHHPLSVWLMTKSIGPRLNQTQHLLLHSSRWLILWSN